MNDTQLTGNFAEKLNHLLLKNSKVDGTLLGEIKKTEISEPMALTESKNWK